MGGSPASERPALAAIPNRWKYFGENGVGRVRSRRKRTSRMAGGGGAVKSVVLLPKRKQILSGAKRKRSRLEGQSVGWSPGRLLFSCSSFQPYEVNRFCWPEPIILWSSRPVRCYSHQSQDNSKKNSLLVLHSHAFILSPRYPPSLAVAADIVPFTFSARLFLFFFSA